MEGGLEFVYDSLQYCWILIWITIKIELLLPCAMANSP